MATEPAPRADVPEQLALTRRERRQRNGPDYRASSNWPSLSKKVVIKSGRQADHSAFWSGGDFLWRMEIEGLTPVISNPSAR